MYVNIRRNPQLWIIALTKILQEKICDIFIMYIPGVTKNMIKIRKKIR